MLAHCLLAIVSIRKWWAGTDSNRRRRMPADLQSAPFVHFGTCPIYNYKKPFLASNHYWLEFQAECLSLERQPLTEADDGT